jgi:hypothetical protein
LAEESGDRNAKDNPVGILNAAQDDSAPTDTLSTSADALHSAHELLQAYEAGMAAIAQRFSTTLIDITQAVPRGELTSEQGQKASAEQYQLAHGMSKRFVASRFDTETVCSSDAPIG